MAYSLTGIVRDPENGKPVTSRVLVKTYRLDTFAAGPTATSATSGVVTLTGLTDGVQYAAYADYGGRRIQVPLLWSPSYLGSSVYGTTSELADVVSSATGESAGTSALIARADHRHAIAAGSIVNADVSGSAAIAYSKLNLGSSIVNADVSGSAAIAYSKLNLVSSIVNADVSGSAAIAYSKLNLGSSIVNADVSGSAAIAYSKLNLGSSIVNADVSGSAAIAYSKLNLGSSIVNADVSGSAAIAYSKLNLGSSIVNADVSASAAIVASKIAAGTFGAGAYTFPANSTVTVNGNGVTLLDVDGSAADMVARLRTSGIGGPYLVLDNNNATAGNRYPGIKFRLNGTNTWSAGLRGSSDFTVFDEAGLANRLSLTTAGLLTTTAETSGTNDVVSTVTYQRLTSGTPANGIGQSIDFVTEYSAGSTSTSGRITVALSTASSAESYMAFGTNISGTGVREVARFTKDGYLGIGTTTPSGGLQVNAAVSETAHGTGNIRLGVLAGTPRVIFEYSGSTQWEIDNYAGDLRIFVPGTVHWSFNSANAVAVANPSATRAKVHMNAQYKGGMDYFTHTNTNTNAWTTWPYQPYNAAGGGGIMCITNGDRSGIYLFGMGSSAAELTNYLSGGGMYGVGGSTSTTYEWKLRWNGTTLQYSAGSWFYNSTMRVTWFGVGW